MYMRRFSGSNEETFRPLIIIRRARKSRNGAAGGTRIRVNVYCATPDDAASGRFAKQFQRQTYGAVHARSRRSRILPRAILRGASAASVAIARDSPLIDSAMIIDARRSIAGLAFSREFLLAEVSVFAEHGPRSAGIPARDEGP